MAAMSRCKAVRLDAAQIAALTRAAVVKGPDEKHPLVVNKELLGQDPTVLAERIGLKVPADTELLFGETDESNPFVPEEQMMPFVPFVRVPDVHTPIPLATKHDHPSNHPSLIH